ncbi:MAG: hypothetical protein ACM37W_10530 [Actinomycetota bacterium]
MSDSVLDRIRKNRKQAVVLERSDSLVASLPSSEPVTPDDAIPKENTGATLEELKQELAQLPKNHRHSAIVLEEEIDTNLTRFCKDQGITIEVFLEAAWMLADPDEAVIRRLWQKPSAVISSANKWVSCGG